MTKECQIKTISVHELKAHYDNAEQISLIDVRELDEWREQHIPGAIHIPKDTLISLIQEKIPEHSKPIYLHCRAGVRSLHAANCLLELGYKEVYSVDGGIVEWEKAGYPVKTAIDDQH